jgi:D-sedoheptulose 7-phosphate isomerase
MASERIELIRSTLRASAGVLDAMAADRDFSRNLEAIADAWIRCLRAGGKIMLAGNGGSAADAQHVAGELVNRFNFNRPALAGLALSADTSVLTCIGNDSAFDEVFARQIDALGKPGDVFCAISTSGNSRNILAAAHSARRAGVTVVGFTGKSGGALAKLCDHVVRIPHASTARIQEGHLACYHAICGLVEKEMHGADAEKEIQGAHLRPRPAWLQLS